MITINFLRATFSSPMNDFKKIESELFSLQREIFEISMMENKVEGIVRLFKVVSPLFDKSGFCETIEALQKKNYGQLDKVISAFEVLQIHFRKAGRSRHGLNRTEIGEEVTSEKVFLGNVFGLWTKPASYWLANQDELTKTLRPDVSKDPENPASNWYLINDYQAGEFVQSHTESMLEQLGIILEDL